MTTLVRAATAADAPALAAIYGHHALNGFGTFEEHPPSTEEMASRLAAVQARGLPYLAAEVDGQVAAFAYAGPFRLRTAYRYTVEDSVYVAPGHQGQGLGKLVLGRVIQACEAMGLRQMLAVIGDSENAGSIGVHASLGFRHAGVMQAVGYKKGRWLDVVIMQLALNGGGEGAPEAPGLDL
ncbi:GNAT family N-acetyltransferase [Phenylobacterium montanum]|uniref:N-acetyltransferase n=1 Tax=Phenylobacterium montanum TaxID=2823693 RepID=A0A975FYA8_9CAUL|nr:GNAT family N-acetyltransferase [Caulobacter sp. S6]QUD87703.1 N-acetyltransferase [Caulobacter sp. S6]